MTLPEDVLRRLESLHADPAWAIVGLVESHLGGGRVPRAGAKRSAPPAAELVRLGPRQALIVVDPATFTHLRGVSVIGLADGRGFLALDRPGGIAELELAMLDQLAELPARSPRRARLEEAHAIVRQWRRSPRRSFDSKSIILVTGAGSEAGRPLARLRRQKGKPRRSR
jgi:hypothetical protein